MIETAGGGHGMGTGFVALSGVKNAMALRGHFLAQRDAIVFGEERAAAKPTSPAAAVANEKSTDVLIEIRDSLRRMEAMMDARQTDGSRRAACIAGGVT